MSSQYTTREIAVSRPPSTRLTRVVPLHTTAAATTNEVGCSPSTLISVSLRLGGLGGVLAKAWCLSYYTQRRPLSSSECACHVIHHTSDSHSLSQVPPCDQRNSATAATQARSDPCFPHLHNVLDYLYQVAWITRLLKWLQASWRYQKRSSIGRSVENHHDAAALLRGTWPAAPDMRGGASCAFFHSSPQLNLCRFGY